MDIFTYNSNHHPVITPPHLWIELEPDNESPYRDQSTEDGDEYGYTNSGGPTVRPVRC